VPWFSCCDDGKLIVFSLKEFFLESEFAAVVVILNLIIQTLFMVHYDEKFYYNYNLWCAIFLFEVEIYINFHFFKENFYFCKWMWHEWQNLKNVSHKSIKYFILHKINPT
jgi:hypothetical protein